MHKCKCQLILGIKPTEIKLNKKGMPHPPSSVPIHTVPAVSPNTSTDTSETTFSKTHSLRITYSHMKTNAMKR